MNIDPLFAQAPDSLIHDSIARIEFEPCAKQNYGFDAYTKGKQHIFYQHLPTQTGRTYHVAWKSIAAGKTDFVDVKLKYLFNGFSRKNLHFETSTGQPVKYKLINSEAIYRLQIKGEQTRSKQGKTYSISAYYKKDGQNFLVGKLNIKPYNQIKKNISIVPVNGADIDINELEKHINDIFKQAVAKIKITEIPLSIPQDSLNLNGLTEYDIHQKRLGLFKRHLNKNITDSIQADYFLFLFEPDPLKPNERTTLNAVNYENQPYGIFYLKKGDKENIYSQITQTAAHGCSKLRHSWEMGAGSQNGTDNLMDYKGGTDLYVYQWQNIHDPVGGLGWFQDAEEGKLISLVSVDEARGISCDGWIISNFYSNNNSFKLVPSLSPGNPYVFTGFYLYDKATGQKEGGLIPCSEFKTSDKITVEITDKSTVVPLFTLTSDNCTYNKYLVEWEYTEGMDVNKIAESKISGKEPLIRAKLKDADISCFVDFITMHDNSAECQDNESVDKNYRKLQGFLDNKGDVKDLVRAINTNCKSAIKKFTYDELESFFTRIADLPEYDEYQEIAIIRLMSCINSSDYPAFYDKLEAEQNKYLKSIIGKISDHKLYAWEENNYTNFIRGLIQMYNLAPASYISRISDDASDKLTGQIINLNEEPFESVLDNDLMGIAPTNQYRYNGRYVSSTGEIEIYKEEKVISNTVGPVGDPVNAEHWSTIKDTEIGLSPMDPVFITSKNNLPLVKTALGEPIISQDEKIYVVPAIFFKYKSDKEFNQKIEEYAVITLDIVTIVGSGGTAFATKVHWLRRAWAMMEVAGAIANIAVNTSDVGPEFKEAVDIYNGAMAVIGLTHLASGAYKVAKQLPATTRQLLFENKNIRAVILSKYLDWQAAVNKLGDLSDAERQIVSKQEKIWQLIGVKKVFGTIDDLLGRLNKSVVDDLNKLTSDTRAKILSDMLNDANFERYVNNNPVISKAFTAHKNDLSQLEVDEINNLLKQTDIPLRAKYWADRGLKLRNMLSQSRAFDDGIVFTEIKRLYPSSWGKQITLKVTKTVNGKSTTKEIIPDYLVREGDNLKIVDAKYTTKSADDFELQKALTPNQDDVFAWLKDPKLKGKIEIEIRANNDKLELLRLKTENKIPQENLGIEIMQSQAGNANAIEKTIKVL